MFKNLVIGLFVISFGMTGSVQAALYDRGNGLVYDDVLNVTWSKDPNLFYSMGIASGNFSNFVNQIVQANNGVIHDTPNYGNSPQFSGTYQLINGLGTNYCVPTQPCSSYDFNDDGTVSWWGAQAFVNYLNDLDYKGYNNWRLPLADSSIYQGSGTATSELSYMILDNLGNSSSLPSNPNWTGYNFNSTFLDAANDNVSNSFFNGLDWRNTWTGTEISSGIGPLGSSTNISSDYYYVQAFFNTAGFSAFLSKPSNGLAWIVRDGDVAPIPIPTAIWLFVSGLGLLGIRKLKA